MNNKLNNDNWLKFLDPENFKGNLIMSSVYIATFEAFKEYLVENIKSFFAIGIMQDGIIISEEYNKKVRTLDPNEVKSILLWLKNLEAVTDIDIELYDSLRKYRNDLAHRLLSLMFENLSDQLPVKYDQLLELRIKIEKWWVLNIEVPTNPDYDNIEVKEDDITTAGQILARLISDLISGDEHTANYYRNELNKLGNR